MKLRIIIFAVLIASTTIAHKANVFLDRDFWKAEPSVELIKQKIAEGHNPSESDDFAFDGVSYGIIDNAPLESIKFMLTQEGNPVTKPTHGSVSYLLWAAYKGNIDLMKHLLDLGADVHMATSRGTNILSMTAIGGIVNTEVYDLILSKNVDIHSSNSSGANALLLLAGSNADDASTFEYLVKKGLSWNSQDADGIVLFNFAAFGGNMYIMMMCVGMYLDYTSINSKGENALFFASYGRKRSEIQLETFKYLESLGLEVDVVNWEGQTPLHNAIFRANEETINFFIENGVNPNQVDKYGNTVLINAARGKVENMEVLLPHVADINHQNHEGHTVLSMAVKRGSEKVFDFLVEQGADLHLLDAQKNDLMSLAFQSFRSRQEAAYDHIITALMEHELQLADAYDQGNTLAHLAIEQNSAFLLKKAIALGANVNAKNDIGLSPLHLAAMKATDKDMIELLLEAGADKSLHTDFEESAYQLASENELLNGDAVATELLKMED